MLYIFKPDCQIETSISIRCWLQVCACVHEGESNYIVMIWYFWNAVWSLITNSKECTKILFAEEHLSET